MTFSGGAVPIPRIVVIGAGVGGLTAALALAARGLAVVVVEQASVPGGKMRELDIDGQRLDGGPTVLTMKWVLEEIFADAGTSLAEHLTLRALDRLARHAWSAHERLDLFADVRRSQDAIGDFAGPAEARRYRQFCDWTRQIYQTLDTPFLRSPRPSLMKLIAPNAAGFARELWPLAPFSTAWRALGRYFHDPRLRQLFGRYATYCGSSPFLAPATLMLIAHVEQCGVWIVDGGMHRLAAALGRVAAARGARLRYGAAAAEIVVVDGRAAGVTLTTGERLDADAVIVTADVAAVAAGRFGRTVAGVVSPVRHSQRSLSAITWAMVAGCEGFPLVRHNVFFSQDYAAEFHDLFGRGRLPTAPTVYVCAQDRAEAAAPGGAGPERLFCLVNAPPSGDSHAITARELDQCEQRTFGHLERCGLHIKRRATMVTTPSDFERMFPATGGALYGRASHGWAAAFRRPGSRTRMPGLYLAGGSTHPGAGVPTAALSGRSAAAMLLADFASTERFGRAAMRGGMSTQ
jgi:1-hydroxycarotenoid 3,4-desaturase